MQSKFKRPDCTSYVDGSKFVEQMKSKQNLNPFPIDLQEVQMDCKWLRDMWSSLKWWWFVKILWSCISCGWEIDMGMDCRHNSFSRKNGDLYPLLYSNLFSKFSPESAQTHWFRIFLSTFLRVRFCPDFCATTATSLYEIQMKFRDGEFRKLLCFANSPLWLHGQKLKPKLEASCVCCRLFTRIQLIWRMVK